MGTGVCSCHDASHPCLLHPAASRTRGTHAAQIRAAWGTDPRTVLVFVDPSSPNILQFRSGVAVQARLARPFFVELQSRYGNLFFVREEVRGGGGGGDQDSLMAGTCSPKT